MKSIKALDLSAMLKKHLGSCPGKAQNGLCSFSSQMDLLTLQQSLSLQHDPIQPTKRCMMARSGRIWACKSVLSRDLKMSCGHRNIREMLREQRNNKGKPMLFQGWQILVSLILKLKKNPQPKQKQKTNQQPKNPKLISTRDHESRYVPHDCLCSNSFLPRSFLHTYFNY